MVTTHCLSINRELCNIVIYLEYTRCSPYASFCFCSLFFLFHILVFNILIYYFNMVYSLIFIISTRYQGHFLVAFNALMFPHVPFDNLNAQVHYHAPPKAPCQLNITRVTRWLGSVHRSNNHLSGLIFFLFFAQVGHFYVLALVGSFLSLTHYQP